MGVGMSMNRSFETWYRETYGTQVAAPAGETWELVAALPERQRIAVVLRYVGDLDEREISDAMGVTRGTVSSTLSAARAALGLALVAAETVEETS